MLLETGLHLPEKSVTDELQLRIARLPESDLSSWLARVGSALALDVIEVWSLPVDGSCRHGSRGAGGAAVAS